jgi:succinate-semialdehyde dehydrogenase/glutarate-semialdehyde dehydrogenase
MNPLIKTQCFINGAWVGTPSLPITNPATGKEIAQVPDLGVEETSQAIDAAHKSFPGWAKLLAKERSTILRRWYELIMENADALAELLTCEQGKPLAEAKSEIAYGASFIEYYGEQAKRVFGEIISPFTQDSRVLVLKQPLGVIAAITPWNFPHAMITRKIAPALAAGCTVVCKPALATPLSALALAALAQQAGMPKGVLNILTTSDSKKVGKELATNPLVRGIAFTGSTEVGRTLMEQAAGTIKKVALELGGNAPFIVFDDADPDAAVAGAIASKFRNSGQTCVCANRIFAQANIHDSFVTKLADAIKRLNVGNGMDEGLTQGPLIDRKAVEKVNEHIADAILNGAKIIVGGAPHTLGGTFFEPTLLTGVTKAMRLMHEETFGPVALEVGMVGVNSGIISSELVPFGGVKQSGLGREGSPHGIEEYVELKYVLLSGFTP